MPKFAQVVETVEALSSFEQETLLEIMRRRIAERRRAELIKEVRLSRRQFASGKYRLASADEIVAYATK